MDNWIENDICTGCSACANSCPEGAIEMICDKYGFKHPIIDQEKCIDCQLCVKTCPIVEKKESNNYEHPKVYAAWSLDQETRYNSTSGGVFSEFARYILSQNGLIVGAVYNKDNMVNHSIIGDENGLKRARQSKYLESEIGKIFIDIKKELNKGLKVGFCGSPCQVSGLLKYLKKSYDNLYTFDFICRGANSPKAYSKWLEYLEKKYKSRVKKVWFKNKEKGWNKFSTRIDFENGRIYRKDRYHDLYMRGYLEKNLYIRPSCARCNFKGLPRESDITLADFWGIEKSLDCDMGTSMIIVNNEKGMSLINKISSNIYYTERNLAEALKGNSMLDKSVWISKFSHKFLESLDFYRFDKAFKAIVKEIDKLKN